MKSHLLSDYELALEKFFTKYSSSSIAAAIRQLIKKVYERDADVNAFKALMRCSKYLSVDDEIVRLKPADLKRIVKEKIINNLDNENVRDRAIIIFKYLSNAYTGERQGLDEIENGIESIQKNKIFPKPGGSLHREGHIGKYKAVGNIFTTTEIEPSQYTLKFCLAILDIPLDKFELFIERNIVNASERAELNQSKLDERKPKKVTKSMGYLIFSVLGSVIVLVYLIWPPDEEKSGPARKRVNSSEFFSESFVQDEFQYTDSVWVEVISWTPTNAYISLQDQIIPVNEALLRFRICNSTPAHIFPDLIGMESSKILSDSEPGDIHQLSAQLDAKIHVFFVNSDEKWSTEAVINDGAKASLEPMSITLGSLYLKSMRTKISGQGTYQLHLTLHSGDKESIQVEAHPVFLYHDTKRF